MSQFRSLTFNGYHIFQQRLILVAILKCNINYLSRFRTAISITYRFSELRHFQIVLFHQNFFYHVNLSNHFTFYANSSMHPMFL